MGCNQTVCDDDEDQGPSQLHLAAESGDTEAVRSLLMSSANVDVLDIKHNTPLHYATLNGHIDVVSLLLSKNASVNSRNASGQTSLHLAAEIEHLAIAQLLLDSNAEVHVTDQSNNTPIHIAVTHGHYELVKVLLGYSDVQMIRNGNTPLHLAAKFGHTNVVLLFLNHNENADAENFYGDTPIHLALENGYFEVAKALLRNSADANIRNASGKTPLHITAELGQAELVKAIIDHEVEVNAVDRNGDTALHLAACNGHSAVVNILLNQTRELDAQIRSQLAVNKVPTDEFELSQNPIKNIVDAGHTSQAFAAEGGNVEIVDTLLSHSSTVNTVFIEGQTTPFHLAVKHEPAEIVENLIFNGANVNACNNAKMTALHLACQNGHTSIVEILLDNHAAVDATKQSLETPFYLAAKNGHADIADLLLCRGVCDFVLIYYIQAPLHVAIKEGHTKVVEVILKHSRRISGKLTKDGHKLQENAKNYLIETRYITPIELLRSGGRRLSAGVVWAEQSEPLEIWRDSYGYGQTALELAVFSTQPKMVKLLLNVDEFPYSEGHLTQSFGWMITSIYMSRNSTETAKDPDDGEQYEINCEDLKEIAEAIITSSKFNVNRQNENGETPLDDVMTFVYSVSIWPPRKIPLNHLIQLLLEKGADFNIRDPSGITPLISASEMGCCHAIQLLFDWEQKSGMKLDLDARDQHGATALIAAAERHHVSAVRMLLNHKASVNLYDYCGFTALHAAIYEPQSKWLDLHFFCKWLLNRNFDGDDYLEIISRDKGGGAVDPRTVIERFQKYLELQKGTTRIKEEVVQLLLDNDKTNLNAVDFRGNTPLDLAVKSSKRITSATLEALKNRGAIRKFQEPEDEAPIEVARIDQRGRNPLHRFTISSFVDFIIDGDGEGRFDLMFDGILLRKENFRESATATDYKGRTPLHYAVMPQPHGMYHYQDCAQVRLLLEIGSNVNVADMYGKTPLHYAEKNDQYKFLVQYGAHESRKDNFGHTPRELKQLRELVTINKDNAEKLTYGETALFVSWEFAQELYTNHVTELSKRKVIEAIRIYSESPPPQESSEEAIWKIWIQNDFFRLNRRLSQLKPLIQHFFERLADGIKEKDWRFECQPVLVGSANEETKVVISADFDFNLKLIKFSQLCDPFPHPLGPKGYFQLRRKPIEDIESRSDERFDSFFNLDHCLLTNEVKSRFKIILQEVLRDPTFWLDEHLFEHLFDWNVIDKFKGRSVSTEIDGRVCMTVRLRMIHPIEDGEGALLFVNISVDIAACVHVEGWWPEDQLPVDISSDVKANGSTLIFDRPRFDPSKPYGCHLAFSETFARMSFAPLESRIIRKSSPLIKAAYMVCKMILYFQSKTTYQLKTCLLFCMEAFNAQNGSETINEEEITPKQLAFWVERLMFCFKEFSRHDVYPCYFMPSFRQRVIPLHFQSSSQENSDNNIMALPAVTLPFVYSMAHHLYLNVWPNDTTIDIPMEAQIEHRLSDSSALDPNRDPKWEQFDREDFIRTLSSRSFH